MIIDLDSSTCEFNPIEAIEYVKQGVIFKISRSNLYLPEILSRYKIEIVREEDDVVYFKIL